MKKLFSFLILIVLMTIATGCQAVERLSKGNAADKGVLFAGAPEAMPPPAARMMAAPAPAGAGMEMNSNLPNTPPATAGRIFIRTADITLEVKKLDHAAKEVLKIVEEVGGFISDTSESEDDTGVRSQHLTLRVPSEKLDTALEKLRDVGHVRDDNVRSEDISEQYFDLEIRLNNARKLETRLLALLETNTNKLKDLLDTERELARVRQDIEQMEGRKRNFDTRVSLSTITVTLTSPQGFGRGIFQPLAGLVQRALSAFTTSIAALIVVIAAVVPWFVVLFFMAWGTLRLLRVWIRHKREAKVKKQETGAS